MKIRRSIIAAILLLIATPAFAQQIEGVPNFKDCNDGSLTKAMTDGITLGISPSPPYSNLDPSTKKADGLDVEINEAALHWIGIDKIKYEMAPFGQLSRRLPYRQDPFVLTHPLEFPMLKLFGLRKC